MVVVTTCLSVLAVCAIARVTRVVMERLGLDLTTTLLWFGLAEWPSERPRSRAREVKRAVLDRPRRPRRGRPSPPRPLAGTAGRRRSPAA